MNNTEIEDRLMKLEEMLIHIHRHVQRINEQLDEHDMRLRNAIDLFGEDRHIDRKELDDVVNFIPDLLMTEEGRTPITDAETVLHEKRLKILYELEELEVSNVDNYFEKRYELWNKLP